MPNVSYPRKDLLEVHKRMQEIKAAIVVNYSEYQRASFASSWGNTQTKKSELTKSSQKLSTESMQLKLLFRGMDISSAEPSWLKDTSNDILLDGVTMVPTDVTIPALLAAKTRAKQIVEASHKLKTRAVELKQNQGPVAEVDEAIKILEESRALLSEMVAIRGLFKRAGALNIKPEAFSNIQNYVEKDIEFDIQKQPDLPFLLRAVDNDLPAQERGKYATRSMVVIGGVDYWVYLRKPDKVEV